MKRIYEAWQDPADGSVMIAAQDAVRDHREKGLLSPNATMLYSLEAATFEEACAIHNLRMGYEPYSPNGEPGICPQCSATYYPESSGECWRCDYKS